LDVSQFKFSNVWNNLDCSQYGETVGQDEDEDNEEEEDE